MGELRRSSGYVAFSIRARFSVRLLTVGKVLGAPSSSMRKLFPLPLKWSCEISGQAYAIFFIKLLKSSSFWSLTSEFQFLSLWRMTFGLTISGDWPSPEQLHRGNSEVHSISSLTSNFQSRIFVRILNVDLWWWYFFRTPGFFHVGTAHRQKL